MKNAWNGSSWGKGRLCVSAHFQGNGTVRVPVSFPEERFWQFRFRCWFLETLFRRFPVPSWKCEIQANGPNSSETGRIRFRRVRFQTPNSVSFPGLTEFRGANSVSSSRPIIYVPKRTHRVFRRTHRVCRRTQWVLSSETVLSKQYSAHPGKWSKLLVGSAESCRLEINLFSFVSGWLG